MVASQVPYTDAVVALSTSAHNTGKTASNRTSTSMINERSSDKVVLALAVGIPFLLVLSFLGLSVVVRSKRKRTQTFSNGAVWLKKHDANVAKSTVVINLKSIKMTEAL